MSKIPRIGLNMIVKNKESVIERCLESIYKYIEYWVICDTGSTDTTKEVIQNFFDKKKIPGEIIDISWEGFGKSRTKALEYAKGKMEYALMMEADDSLEGTPIFPKTIDADIYFLKVKQGPYTFDRRQIFRLDRNWKYEGVIYGLPICDLSEGEKISAKLQGDYYIASRNDDGGHQSVTRKVSYLKDAEVLLDALTNEQSPHYEPENSRYMFYLAQSYYDAGDYERAKEWYLKRISADGWEEEVYFSMYRVGECNIQLEHSWQEIEDSFLESWSYRPCRVEPLWQLARLYREAGNPRVAYLFVNQALQIPFPKFDGLFIIEAVWDWLLLDELAATAYYMKEYDKGLNACKALLENKNYPKERHARCKDNILMYQEAKAEYERGIEYIQNTELNHSDDN